MGIVLQLRNVLNENKSINALLNEIKDKFNQDFKDLSKAIAPVKGIDLVV